ncbi:MAG: hypothetical protein ACKPKO_47810 [Candidatus Fonsibacter sp.]
MYQLEGTQPTTTITNKYQHDDEFFESASSNKGKFLKFPRFKANLKYNFDGLYNYHTKIAHINMQDKDDHDAWQVVSAKHNSLQQCRTSWRTPMASVKYKTAWLYI